MRYFIIIIFCLGLLGCNRNVDVREIVGDYAIDKGIIRDTSIKIENFTILTINTDMSFRLRHKVTPSHSDITGNWKVMEVLGEEVKIQFEFQNKQIVAPLRHNSRFDFDYPNEFHQGKYNHLLYFKLDDKIENIYLERKRYKSNPDKSSLIDTVLISDDSSSFNSK